MFEKDSSDEMFYMVYIKAVSRGIILSIILLLLASVIFYFTNVNDETIKTAVWIITIVSICYAGIYGAIKKGSRGYLHGAAIGIIYTAIMAIIATLAEKGQLNMQSYLILFIMSIIIGSLSGMIGMVLSNKD